MSIPPCEARKYGYIFATKDQQLEAAVEQFTSVSPEVNRMRWTAQEDALLFDVRSTHGPKWGSIVQFFCNRTQNNIKNRWNTVLKKAKTLGLDPQNQRDFIEAGQKIASRSTRTTLERPREMPAPDPQQLFSLDNLLN
jgi:hypothetical protein